MDRKKYNTCMIPHMRGSKSKEERQRAMCVGAKLCTGKASNIEEAQHICSIPKPPKIKVGDEDLPHKKSKKPKNFMIACKEQALQDADFIIKEIEPHMSLDEESKNMIIGAMVKLGCR